MHALTNLEVLRHAAASNQWMAVWPEMFLGFLALLLLVLEMALPKTRHGWIPRVAILGQLAILLVLLVDYHSPFLDQAVFAGLIRATLISQFMRPFLLLTSILVCGLATVTLAKQAVAKTEFYHIVLVVTAALMLLVQSNHFVMLFVSLETATVGFYILVSYFRRSPLSLEAGLKYLILSALSSAILLFGIVLLYGAAGNRLLAGATDQAMNFGALRGFLSLNPDNFLARVGVVLVLAGVAFKIGAVPFQIWIPDVYQGAPTPVTAFLAVASKAAGFAVLLILTSVFAPLQNIVLPLLAALAAATIILGNLAALTQHNVKRLMGLSGVSHAGYLLLGVIAAYVEPLALTAVYFYLFAYLLATLAVFGVMAHVAGENDAEQELEHYAGLAREHPFLGGVLAIGLGSLAGIPPLAGFMGKLLIFLAVFQAATSPATAFPAHYYYALLAIAAGGVVVSIYYYFGWLKAAYFETWRAPIAEEGAPARPAPAAVGGVMRGTLLALALATVYFGFFQGPFLQWLTLH